MRIPINTKSVESYREFLKIRELPQYSFSGSTAIVPDEFAELLGRERDGMKTTGYTPRDWLFDYQADISSMAIERKKYAVFADCGLGKTAILLEFSRHVYENGGRVLIISPLMVVKQTTEECERFYGDELPLERVRSSDLGTWLQDKSKRLGITNYEALREVDTTPGQIDCLILDESSILKSHYGKYGRQAVELGKHCEYKLALTGTPAPNDRIEYANHSVFVGGSRTVNEFLARYFVNRGQTSNRWELKPHALRPFFRDLSRWCVFLSDPAVYGWADNCESIPPIHVHIDHVDMTPEQNAAVQDLTGGLFAANSGGIGQRSKLGQISKGHYKGESIPTNKYAAIKSLVDSWPDESTIIWCLYNDEQKQVERTIPRSASIRGSTTEGKREEIIDDFKAGRIQTLISKPSILGFGLNLQIATRQIFSGLQDSYEQFYQAVKRSNRYGSTRPLNVHIPVCDVELPMVQNVLNKSERIDSDTREQEELFKSFAWGKK